MAWGVIFVAVFLVVLFVVVLPTISGSRNNRGYSNQGHSFGRGGQWGREYHDDARQWRSGPSQDYGPRQDSRPQGGGCQQVLILLLFVLLVFAAGVIFWSISVQAGGRLF